ncbi:protein kinase [Phormidium sp. CLA17]|uniref:protein kinase domain-containing protein n=1 Tax=Leptolyngbya sp. Cla-17 TaxID=2803751 RepID=UPI0014916F53|nr:protein kinase [Leptolyngbya sp. Cla-17]MBM0741028.1 protein kinase [Leptolyngbya sp. Cla-17]
MVASQLRVILTLLHPQNRTPLRQWQFDHETIIRVGRSPDNHVMLGEAVVSRQHLELRRVEAHLGSGQAGVSWQLINHSNNGTFVDGEVIAQKNLVNDALIQLAQNGPTLRFQTALISTSQALQLLAEPAIRETIFTGIAAPLTGGQSAPTRCTHTGNPSDNLFCIHCGQPIRVDKIVRQYQVLRVLGRGGMGTTYLVWNPTGLSKSSGMPEGKLQVLKEMNADVAQIPKAQELFEREASTLKALSHPGIPRYYDFFMEADKKYLVMELIHGQDLEKRVRKQGAVSIQEAIAWMVQVCEVLTYLHTRSTPIIHRDIKPGNLLVRNLDNQIAVLDFGAVKALAIAPGTRIGAEGYSAPEQVQGRPVPQSDLYAIAPTLVFLLTSISPQRFYKKQGKTMRLQLDEEVRIPKSLRDVIERTTATDIKERYQTAQELSQALKACL